MRSLGRLFVFVVATGTPASLVGCSGTSDAGGAAIAAGVAVAATGAHRAITKDCWARCSKGYVCNQETGLCEPGECIPACPAGSSCTVSPTGNMCLSTKVPTVNPMTQSVTVSRLPSREAEVASTGSTPGTGATPLRPVGERNAAGQVAVPRGNPGSAENTAQPQPEDHQNQEGNRFLEEQGAAIFEQMTMVREKWAPLRNYTAVTTKSGSLPTGPARVMFARYLNAMHARLHSVYAGGFLARLDELPRAHALQHQDLTSEVELIIDGKSGTIEAIGLIQSSGNEDFDAGTLEAISLAGPFGPASEQIFSSDGRLYIHWEFYRKPDLACSTYFARPFVLNLSTK